MGGMVREMVLTFDGVSTTSLCLNGLVDIVLLPEEIERDRRSEDLPSFVSCEMGLLF